MGAAYSSGKGNPVFGVKASQLDKIPAKKPEPLEAIRGGARFAEQIYGRPIPYVIGTGPVDGMPIYGGGVTIVTTTIEWFDWDTAGRAG